MSLARPPPPVSGLRALTHHRGHSPSHYPAGVLLEGQGPPPQWWEGGPFQVPPPPKCGGVQALGSQGMWLQGAAQGQHSLSHLVAAREQQPPTQQVLGTERQIRELMGPLNTVPHAFPQPPTPHLCSGWRPLGGWQVAGPHLAAQKGLAGWGPGRGLRSARGTQRQSEVPHSSTLWEGAR